MPTTPTPGVSVTPSCSTQAECRKDGEAAIGGGAILAALVVAILFIAMMSKGRSSR